MRNSNSNRSPFRENLTFGIYLFNTLLICFSLQAAGDTGSAKTFKPTDCALDLIVGREIQSKYIALAPRLPDEIVRMHKVFPSGEVLEFQIFTNHNQEIVVPGYLQDLATVIESSHPGAAEAIRTHGVRANIDFIR